MPRRSDRWVALTMMVGLAASLARAPSAAASETRFLPQSWDGTTREAFWFTSQGSQLISYRWFEVLEQADSRTPFAASDHMNALRFIPAPKSDRNPGGLPIGFALDAKTGRVGFTCAACHTGQIDYHGTSLVLDGAPALANFDRFLNELVAALTATARDDAKFDRFAHDVLGGGASEARTQTLRDELTAEIEPLELRRMANWPTLDDPARYSGFGRVDAYGQIYNQVTALDLGVRANARTPNAPASYSPLWGAPWSDIVQWNGAGRNRLAAGPVLVGPLLRNLVEVMSIFGRVEFTPRFGVIGYASQIDMDGLGYLEGYLCSLEAPPWPAELFGQPDPRLVSAGRAIYARRCAGCHGLDVQIDQPYTTKLVPLDQIGTDPTYAHNAHDRTANTGELAGTPKNLIPFTSSFGDDALAWEVLQNATFGVAVNRFGEVPDASRLGRCESGTVGMPMGEQFFLVGLKKIADKYTSANDINLQTMPLGYRARPLNGVWATAPYLHNGSVPNLTELLKPPEDRVKVFHVGSREYDPVNVGFVSTPGPGTTELDTTLADVGNSNQGHSFANGLTEPQREALREYLKTL